MNLQLRIALVMVGIFILAGLIGAAIYANYIDGQDCRARGGMVHCQASSGTHGVSTTCDCYWPDGRVMLR